MQKAWERYETHMQSCKGWDQLKTLRVNGRTVPK